MLVVDPDASSAEVWARVVETAGLVVDRLIGDAVIPELRETAYGCVVVNASAPGGASTGFRVVEAIRHDTERQVRRVGIVLVLPHPKNRIFAWESGIDDLLVLPVDAERLVAAVTAVLERPRAERREHRDESLAAARRDDPMT